jgi:hypothetical protein
MILLARFFSVNDIVLFPICFLLLFFILRSRANRNKDRRIRNLYYRAFYFKTVCVLLFVTVTEFYFKGGDTALYYQATKDLRTAISDNSGNLWELAKTSKLTWDSPLFPYFYYDNYEDDMTYGYMLSSNNFFAPKVAVIPSILFGHSFLCISMFFGFFALIGSIRLFKSFFYFYPHLYRPLALACLFLPGVVYWSSGLLKDPLSFGCIGLILYALVNIFFRKRNFYSSVFWLLVSGYILFNVKIYILLVLVLSILIWQFAEFNKLIKDRTLRGVFTIMTFTIGAFVGFYLLNYITSLEAAQQYKLDTLMESVQKEREGYAMINQVYQGDSHFQINASNPVLLFINSIVATFFRPFIWEINSPIAALSAFESAIFLLITLFILFKTGVKKFFSLIFSDGRILMCFVFAIVFAFAVGSSTANFGALSRYKIPATPFYMLLVLLLFNKARLPYPKWFNSIINFAVPKN